MEKDIAKIPKNADTDIVIRIDDFGGRVGLTIREFVKGERYTGFTKAGTRIPVEQIKQFKDAISSIDEKEMSGFAVSSASAPAPKPSGNLSSESKSKSVKSAKAKKEIEGIEEEAM